MTASSSVRVMGVLPGDAITAPRLPPLKSYCLRIVLLRLDAGRLSSGDYARPLTTRCMNHHQDPSQCVEPQGQKALLPGCIRSSIVTAPGSRSTCSPSAKLTPCLRRLDRALAGSNSMLIRFNFPRPMSSVSFPRSSVGMPPGRSSGPNGHATLERRDLLPRWSVGARSTEYISFPRSAWECSFGRSDGPTGHATPERRDLLHARAWEPEAKHGCAPRPANALPALFSNMDRYAGSLGIAGKNCFYLHLLVTGCFGLERCRTTHVGSRTLKDL